MKTAQFTIPILDIQPKFGPQVRPVACVLRHIGGHTYQTALLGAKSDSKTDHMTRK